MLFFVSSCCPPIVPPPSWVLCDVTALSLVRLIVPILQSELTFVDQAATPIRTRPTSPKINVAVAVRQISVLQFCTRIAVDIPTPTLAEEHQIRAKTSDLHEILKIQKNRLIERFFEKLGMVLLEKKTHVDLLFLRSKFEPKRSMSASAATAPEP